MYYLMSYHTTQDRLIKHGKPVVDNIDRILNITEEEKVAAVRNYLYEKLPKSGHEPICEVAIELCKQCFPDDAAAIEAKHRETYERRKEKIDARIAEMKANKESKTKNENSDK